MLYVTHLPHGGYFHTKNEIRPVKIQYIFWTKSPHISHPEEARTWCTESLSKNKINRQKFKFWNSKINWHATHPLKLVDKMCKYEIDLTSTVEDTADTIWSTDRRTDRRTDRKTDRLTKWNRRENCSTVIQLCYIGTMITRALHDIRSRAMRYWMTWAWLVFYGQYM